jgi:serine/threonine protein kinase/Flp pilus assembly protein TadD
MSTDFDKLREVFQVAVEQHAASQWDAYLDQACAGDRELRHKVALLLKAHAEGGSLVDQAAPDMDRTRQYQPIAEGPGTVIGPYKLMEQIGEGGMGLVFVAEQQQPVKRRVALKVIKPGMDSRQVIARFEAERQALAIMDHPHIAKVYDGGATPEGRPYFVMELVKGTPITDYCDQHRLSTRQRLELFLDVCHAVQHAHQKGIIHRDLKPSNVLVEVHDVQPVVKVIDFGIAKAMGQQLTDKTVYTAAAQMVGTPLYMSPEQAGLSSLDVDTRSDVYSLGVLLYELLTGTTPFDKETLRNAGYDEMRRIIREEEPPRPSGRLSTLEQAALSTIAEKRSLEPRRLSQQLRGELDWIVMKALEKDRNRRYESASAFAADVQRYLEDEPVHACPPSKLYLLRKFVRRHRAGMGVAAGVLLAVLLGVSSLLWWLQKRAGAAGEARVAVQEAHQLLEAERWSEALSAARRAEGVLAGIGGNAGLRQQVQELIVDLEMARRLQEAQLRESTVTNGHFDLEAGAVAYAEAFREYGLDLDGLDPDMAAEQIRSRSIHRRLVAALDDWAICLKDVKAREWRQRLAVARAADPDPLRNRLRDMIEGKDRKAVEEFVAAGVEKEWPSQTLALLAKLAGWAPSVERADFQLERVGVLLMRAQQRRPSDFWINDSLVQFLSKSRPRHLEEQIRYASVAVALQPQSPGAHLNLGSALHDKGRLDEAIAEYREAIRLKQDYSEAHSHLGNALKKKGQLDEAIAECREAVRHNSHSFESHSLLGLALMEKGQLDEAIAECREATRLNKDEAGLHLNLGAVLAAKGQLDEAIAAYREALRLKKDYAEPHVNLGYVLVQKGQLDEAIAEYREAIRLDKGLFEAHMNIGGIFLKLGEFRKAQEALRRARELSSSNPRYRQITSSQLQKVQRFLELEPRLPRMLKGEEQPADALERLTLADLCSHKNLYAASARWYAEAFGEQPSLADDLSSGHRYDAACSAALAGCGQGKDAASLGNKEHGRLRRQALSWLKDDLQAKQRLLEKDPDRAGPMIGWQLRHWMQAPDFSGVRGAEDLAKLPEAERQSWQKLWADVGDTLAGIGGKAAPKKKPDTK